MNPEIQVDRGGGGTVVSAKTTTAAGGGGRGEEKHYSPPQPPPMSSSQNHHLLLKTTPPKPSNKKLTLIPLIFLIYFEVSGGPYGSEPTVQAAGPLLALLGFLLFPFIWSIPEALVTAELSTAFPGNGGYVVWAHRAFGPLPASLMATWKLLSGVINNAAYPVLCADYLSRAAHPLSSGLPRAASVAAFTLLLSFLNYTGLTIVGYAAVALGAASLAPFVLMAVIAIPRVRPGRWIRIGGWRGTDWRLYFNTLFWNLNFWDNASTMAGEVEQPQRTFPRALLAAGVMTCLGYLVPLFAATGALDVPQGQWVDGFYADAAGMIAGKWLKFWIEAGAVLSAIGLFEAQLSSSSFQLLGMADLGFLPRIFALRSKWFNTPWVGILVSSLVTLAISFMSFTDIIASANFLYSLGMLLEFSSFIWLRKKYPTLKRPYRVPMGVPGLVCMCLVPSGFLVFVMSIASWMVYVISGGLTLLGIGVYYVMGYCRSKGYFEFSKGEEKGGEEEGEDVGRSEA